MSRSALGAHLSGDCFWPCHYCDVEDAREAAAGGVDPEPPEAENDHAATPTTEGPPG